MVKDTINNALVKVTIGFLLLSIGLYAAESFMYYGFLAKYLLFYPEVIAVSTGFFLIITRIKGIFPTKVILFCIVSAIICLICASVFGFINQNTHPNFIFSRISIHPELLGRLGLILSGFSLLSASLRFIRGNMTFLLLIFPFWLLAAVTVFWLYYPEIYDFFKIEDSGIEYFTFFAYIMTSIFGVLGLKAFRKRAAGSAGVKTLGTIVYSMIIIGAFFVAGEEVSWGQRFIGFETPPDIKAVNDQNEFNLHNTPQFMEKIYYMYVIITLIALTGKTLLNFLISVFKNQQLLKTLRFFTPRAELSGFFIVVLFFALSRLIDFIPEYPNYPEETIEFILGLGIMIHCYELMKRLKNDTLSAILNE